MACSLCEQLPRELPAELQLFLAPPMAEIEAGVRAAAAAAGVSVSEHHPGILRVTASRALMEEFCTAQLTQLTEVEQNGTRALVVPAGTEPSIRDLVHMEPLAALIAKVQAEEILELLRERRLTTYFQPIIDLQDSGKLYAYECLSRGLNRDGVTIPPGHMFSLARKTDLLFYLDRETRVTSIRNAAKHGVSERIFINFNPTAIYRPETCLRTTLEAINAVGIPREQVVFEIVESDEIADTDHLARILEYYREQGFRVALDDLGAGYNSLTSLNSLRPDYMKLDIDLIRDVDRDPYKARISANLLSLADQLGIATIVEGIERVGEYDWAREHGAHYAQGYLFARPAELPPRPEIPSSA